MVLDIVVLGKFMGNGFLIGVVVCILVVVEAFDIGMEFFSIFGGNLVVCVVGWVVL